MNKKTNRKVAHNQQSAYKAGVKQGPIKAQGTNAQGKKITISTSDKNAQVLASTIGGVVLGNLLLPGLGGVIFGGIIGAALANSSSNGIKND